jgi:alpha-mannosidase
MPVGAWRDVLGKLMALPNWRLSFDVEPDSWRRVRAEDPEAYAELCQYFKEPVSDSRVEVVNGSFTQPFGWAMTGESNIRQLLRGIAAVRHHFPEIVIDTFATQEPCWASFFPQILVSLGYKRAILKNSTMWGGYTVGVDAELLNWVGPDGSSLPAVPRYECETVADTWQTISYTGAIEYAERCIEHGIPHPTGVFIQDLGWGAKPWVSADHIQHVTWRDYIT